MAHILIVEDEEKLARFVELELLHEGYQVSKSGNGREALTLAEEGDYDLILLDILLPGLNGLEVLRRLQQEQIGTPVILLTARDAVMDKVAGLDAGAVDYITKPFAIEELLARIRVGLKLHGRTSPAFTAVREEGTLYWKDLRLSEKRHQVTWNGQEIHLTNWEFRMLQVLLEKVCGYDYMGETNVVDVYVRFLRSKIDEVYGEKMICTVRGVGYVIKEE